MCAGAQSCPTLRPHELSPARLFCSWDYPSKNTGVGCHLFLQGIFPAQGANPQLLHLRYCRQILYLQRLYWVVSETGWQIQMWNRDQETNTASFNIHVRIVFTSTKRETHFSCKLSQPVFSLLRNIAMGDISFSL